MVPDKSLRPNTETIRTHLAHITRRWDELDQPCLLEIVHLTDDDKARVKDVAHFSPDDLDAAANHIAAMNSHHLNSYATVNPVDASNRPPPAKRANKSQILASFFHWADADSEEAGKNIKAFVGPKSTFNVLTGSKPHYRPHVYWELEEPTRNLAAWEATQRAIAGLLGTDPAVVDPPRIMRLAGTINWPKPQKKTKGYVPELTRLMIHSEDKRPLVTSENMARAFAGGASTSATPDKDWIDTSGFDGKTASDYADALRRARTDGEKHTGVRDLAASLAGQGVNHALAEAIIRDACPVWDANVEDLLRSAYAKFYQKPADRVDLPPTPDGPLFTPWTFKDLTAIPQPEFVYSDFYARGYTSLTLASPKVGKSMLGLAEALDMATGRGILTGLQRDPLRVVYYNAEDDQNVIDARVAAILTQYGVNQTELQGRFWPTSGVDREGFYLVAGEKGIINEPLFLELEQFCSDEMADVLIFDPLQDLSASPETNEVFRMLGQRLRRMASQCKVSLGLIHHTRKIAPGMTATIEDGRGGSALRGTARFNRILNPMTEEESCKAGVDNHRFFFRIGDMESNLAPPSADVNRWFEKVSVEIPGGQHVGAVRPWQWPDAFDGITTQQARDCRSAFMQRDPPARASVLARDWAGHVIAPILGLDPDDKTDKARLSTILKKWIDTGVLARDMVSDRQKGREIPVIIAGPNALTEGGT